MWSYLLKTRRILSLTFCLCLVNFGSIAYNETDPLIEVKTIIPDLVLDIRYASEKNFLKEQVYPAPYFFLKKSVALRLKRAADYFRERGYRLLIFDGYRPLSVQKKMWKIFPDARYVANPKKGSIHNRGGAIDLSLTDKNGAPLLMPTAYDDFSSKAHHGATNVAPKAQENAKLLKKGMESVGFQSIRTEWWHYNDPKAKIFPLLDLDFAKISEKSNSQ